MSPLLTYYEVAEICKVSPKTIQREKQLGKIGFTKVGHQVRFTEKHIRDYLRRNENPARGH